MTVFHGVYADLIRQYIEFKRNLGYKFIGAEYTYHFFDDFTISQGETEVGITKELATKWSIKRSNESDHTCYVRVMYLVHFSCFLNDMGYPSYVPRLPKAYKSTFTPYIFSHQEVEKIFASCDKLVMGNLMDSMVNVISSMFRMLYGTGIRISEAVVLKIQDVNLDEKYLTIHQSKNGKERIVPFSNSVAEVCRQYSNSINIIQERGDYFFVRRNGRKCKADTIYDWFRKVIWNAGIPHGGRGLGPRLHDFRHAFSVHTLAAMSESG